MATVNDILKIAIAELGVKEYPAGTNKVKYNTWYYGKVVSGASYPWCVVFVQWVFHQAGAAALLPVLTASCTALRDAAKPMGLWVTSGYQAGDLVLYDWGGDRKPDHIGIFEQWTGRTTFTAIEGNTSTGNDSNGGEVMRRSRSVANVLGAVRPQYAKEDDMMSDQQIYEAVIRYSSALKVPESLQAEFQEAIDAGITDGSNPAKLIPRYQAALMALRAAKKAVELNGGCWECKV